MQLAEPGKRSRVRAAWVGCLFAVIVAAFLAVPAAHASPPPKHNPPKSVYLALGDSLAFGYQQAKFIQNLPTEDPAAYNTGYVDVFAQRLRAIDPKIQTVNLGCPGETTSSLLGLAPCPYNQAFVLHNEYSGSQIDAAIAVLRAHPGQVSPVTIDIGANDLLRGVSDLQGTFARVQQNLSRILARIRAAAPYTEIIVLGLYNPLIVTIPGTDPIAAQFNAGMAQVAAQYRARFADPLPVFNPAVNEIPTICNLTLMCTPLHDIHASDAGYQQLANVAFAASGY
jgi:lysophospholipase L1-like esterase